MEPGDGDREGDLWLFLFCQGLALGEFCPKGGFEEDFESCGLSKALVFSK